MTTFQTTPPAAATDAAGETAASVFYPADPLTDALVFVAPVLAELTAALNRATGDHAAGLREALDILVRHAD